MATGAAFYLVFGVWAFFAPSSFAAHVATFKPYNRHLMHDAGAFQTGLGTALVVGLLKRVGPRAAALWGVAAASSLHAAAHFIDRDLGGRGSDPWTLSLLAAAFVAAAALDTFGRRLDATASPAARVRTDPAPGHAQSR
jgi:hypothetical protein